MQWRGGIVVKKSVIGTLLSVLLCTMLLAGCGSDEPTTEQKKADMDKAFLSFAAQISRTQELSTKMASTFDDVDKKKISASQAKEKYEDIAADFLDVAANVKKEGTPKWLSAENKTKFEEMKKLYVEANEAMSSYTKTLAKCSAVQCSTEDRKKISEYGAIRKDRFARGAVLMKYFADGNWKN